MADSVAESSGVLFREEQRTDFRLTLFVCLLMVLGVVVSFVVPQPGLPDHARPVVMGFMFGTVGLSVALLLVVFLKMKLVTEVRETGLTLRCPFLFRGTLDVPLENVASHKVVSASSMFALAMQNKPKMTLEVFWDEIRLRLKKRRVWVMRGSRGVRIDYGDGRFFMVGSQRPEELNEIIGRVLSKSSR